MRLKFAFLSTWPDKKTFQLCFCSLLRSPKKIIPRTVQPSFSPASKLPFDFQRRICFLLKF